jgi:tetratricopeptide (TPR) repeat protein
MFLRVVGWLCLLLMAWGLVYADSPVAPEPSTAERERLLTERERLEKESKALHQAGRLVEAIAAGEQMLAIARVVFGNDHEEVINALEWLADLYMEREDWVAARTAKQEVMEAQSKRFGADHWQVTDARLELQHLEHLVALSPTQRQQVAEARQLSAQVARLYKEGKAPEAVSLATQVLEIRRTLLGEAHPDTATSLNNLAKLHEAQGNYDRAEPLLQQSLAIYRQVFGESHPSTATSLNNLGALYHTQGDYAKAAPLLQQGLEIRRTVLGEMHPNTAMSLNNLAQLYEAQGNYAKAELHLQQSLVITRQVSGEAHPSTITILNNLAELYRKQGNYGQAEPLYQQSLKSSKMVFGEAHPETAKSLNNLGLLYRAKGDYEQAERFLQQSLAVHQQVFGETHPTTAASLSNLGSLYRARGDYHRAATFLGRSLRIRRTALGESHPDTANSLNNLGLLYLAQGDYDRAEPLLQQSLEVHRQVFGETHPATATSFSNLAHLYREQGDYVRAELLYQQSLTIRQRMLGKAHPDTASSLNNLGIAYLKQRNYDRAEPLLQQSLAIHRQIFGETHPDTLSNLNNLAMLYDAKKDYDRAESLHLQSLETSRKMFGEAHPDTVNHLNNLGMFYLKQGDYRRAAPLLRQSLEIAKTALGEAHPHTASSFSNLGLLYSVQGDYSQAEPLLRQSLAILRQHLDRTFAIQSERQQLQMLNLERVSLDIWLSVASPAGVHAANQYQEVLRWKGVVFTAQTSYRLVRQDPATAPVFAELFAEYERVSRQVATLALAVPPPAQRESRQQELAILTERKEALERDLSRRSAAFRQQQAAAEASPALLLQTLPGDTALVDLLEYLHISPPAAGQSQPQPESRLVAFIIRRDRDIQRIDLGLVAPIATAIDDWRRAHTVIPSRQFDAGSDRAAQQLRQRLWEPLAAHLDGVDTLLLSPDGAVGRFPWAALPGSQPGTYLLEDLVFAVVPVPQQYFAQRAVATTTPPAPQNASSAMLLVGGVDYGVSPGTAGPHSTRGPVRIKVDPKPDWRHFKPLHNTGPEVAAIAKVFGARFPQAQLQLLREQGATEEAFRTFAEQARYLHVATHGFFAPAALTSALAATPEAPDTSLFHRTGVSGWHPGLLSGLAFVGANTPPPPDQDDGVLTALEVTALDLSKVDVAVLPACDTGLGPVAGGEGLLGLQRAFQMAGARNVVASLWGVDDQATAALMGLFYYYLWDAQQPPLIALRNAQLFLLRHAERIPDVAALLKQPKFLTAMPPLLEKAAKASGNSRAEPRLWAAFVLSGSGR